MRRSVGLLVLALGVPGVAAAAETATDTVTINIDSAIAIEIATPGATFDVNATPGAGGITYSVTSTDSSSGVTYSALTANGAEISVDSGTFAATDLSGMTLSVTATAPGGGTGNCGTGSTTTFPAADYILIGAINNGNGCSATLDYSLSVDNDSAVDPGQSPVAVNLTYTISEL